MRRILAIFILTFILIGCSEKPNRTDGKTLLSHNWSSIVSTAEGSTVRFYMYGGFAHVNHWIDTYVADEVKKRYGITLVRVPMDAGVFVNKLLTEKSAGKQIGSIDLLWVNGENFKALKEGEALFGPYAEKLPNFVKYVDKGLASIDFGFPVEGYETPYGRAQFVFEYDSARTASPPTTFAELEDWVKANPGLFTYPQPPDFTGSAFIRQAFYATSGGPGQFIAKWRPKLYAQQAPALWEYLNKLKPYLWQEGKAYPKSSAELDTLFARGEVAINMSYHPLHAQSKILDSSYPKSVRTFVMTKGSIFNLHFTAIPENAPNKAGAMTVANFLLSPEAQLAKFDPKNWGDFPAIEVSMLPQKEQAEFRAVDLGKATVSLEKLSLQAVPEIPAQYLEALEKDWEEHVLRQ